MVSCQRDSPLPTRTSTVIIGNGPAALFLSFLLHGNVPYYCADAHPDRLLHAKLDRMRNEPLYRALLSLNRLYEHFSASGQYSVSEAWPTNILLHALLQPDASADLHDQKSAVQFRQLDEYRHGHLVLGSGAVGGQWQDPVGAQNGEGARTLSYAQDLSLPGYTYAQWHAETFGRAVPDFERPRRPDVAAYYAAYPHKLGLMGSMYPGARVTSVARTADGMTQVCGTDARGLAFTIECRRIVLACGLFTHLIEPPDMLVPFIGRPLVGPAGQALPLLVLGSGFSAADAVVENAGRRAVVHLYKWHTARYVSPLKHCHRSSYPEYADVYKCMKMSAQSSNVKFAGYQGFADCEIKQIRQVNGAYLVTIAGSRLEEQVEVLVGEVTCLAGRRTSLDFLGPEVLRTLAIDSAEGWLEKTGLKIQIEPVGPALTIDEGRILCIGSITGDSLVKYMYGAIMGAAGQLYGIVDV